MTEFWIKVVAFTLSIVLSLLLGCIVFFTVQGIFSVLFKLL